MQFEIYPHEDKSGDWVVETTNLPGEGEISTAIFGGSGAEANAREYCEWKISRRETKDA